MPATKLFLTACVLLTLFPIASYSQTKTSFDSNNIDKSYFKASVDYLSNNVYLGRKDSSATPYLTPTIGYYNRTGLFVEGSFSYIPKGNSKIDAYLIDGGYDFESKNNKFSGEIEATKYFFNDSSKSVRSEIKGEIDGSAAYDFGPVSVNGGANFLFTMHNDFILNAGLSHEFDFGNNDYWTLTPTFLTNIGSLNFYKNYYIKRKLRKRFGRQVSVSGKSNFSMLDYEFSLPLGYDDKKWAFFVSPNYIIPTNPIQYFANGIFIKQEKLSNSFYVEANVAYRF